MFYNYEKSVLNGFLEVSTQMTGINNLEQAFDLRSKQAEALAWSVDIANDLFRAPGSGWN